MKHSLHTGKEPSLQKIVIASAVLHLLFITLVVIPIRSKEREFKGYFVNLVRPIEIHREVRTHVARKGKKRRATKKRIPTKKKIAPKKKIVTTQKSLKARPQPKADMSLASVKMVAKEIERLHAISVLSKQKKEEEKAAREIERLREINALLKQEKEREEAHEIEIVRKEIYDSPSEGSGVPSEGSRETLGSYYALIRQRIWSQWSYHDFESAGLETVISIKIDENGKVVSHEIEKSSGDMLFDRSAIKAISRASPLPPPPVEVEIGVRFHL